LAASRIVSFFVEVPVATWGKVEQKNPGESNPAEVFVVVDQRPMWLGLQVCQSFAKFQLEVAKQAGTVSTPAAGEQAHYTKHMSLHGVTMGN
jgi:hypothetical protein